jgi:hypothetical protein
MQTARGTTLYLRRVPKDLVRKLKARAALKGTTLTTLVTHALERAAASESLADADPLEKDMRWYEAHKRTLLDRYSGQYLAIINGRVVDHDREFGALADRVFARVGIRPIFMPRCAADEGVVHLRSPRIVRR